MKLQRLIAIVKKEFLHILRDWRSLYLSLCIPVILIMLFGYALTLDLRKVPFVVMDQSGSAQSRELINLFSGSPYFLLKGFKDTYKDILFDLERGKAMVAIVIPSDFSEKLISGKQTQIQILGDGSDANTSRLAMGYASTIGMIYSQNIAVKRVQAQGRPPMDPPVEMKSRSWYNPDLRSQNVIIPGIIAIVMVVIAAMLTSVTIAREWETGTMEQLISTPLKGPELICGKVIPYFIIGMTDVAIAVTLGKWLFHVPIVGNAGLLFFMASTFLTGALFWGMFLSIVLKTQVLASQIAIVSGYLPTLILSGFVFAIENMPLPIQAVTYIVPARYFIAILRGIYLKGIGLEILLIDAMLLSVYAAIMIFIANKKFKFKLE